MRRPEPTRAAAVRYPARINQWEVSNGVDDRAGGGNGRLPNCTLAGHFQSALSAEATAFAKLDLSIPPKSRQIAKG